MIRLTLTTGILLFLSACNQGGKEDRQSGRPDTDSALLHEIYTESIPVRDTGTELALAGLDEQAKIILFKSILKPVKANKLFDFQFLGQDKLLNTYKNLNSTINRYKDSSDERYTGFFYDVYEQMQKHEEQVMVPDTLDVRSKLEIARLKSDINTTFALKKSANLNP